MDKCVICNLETDQRLYNQKTGNGDFVCSNSSSKALDCKNVWRYRNRNKTEYWGYESYIVSNEWQLKSKAAKILAGFSCERCGKSYNGIFELGKLHAHHNNYKNLYKETKDDIDVLCSSCHKKVHNIK